MWRQWAKLEEALQTQQTKELDNDGIGTRNQKIEELKKANPVPST